MGFVTFFALHLLLLLVGLFLGGGGLTVMTVIVGLMVAAGSSVALVEAGRLLENR